MKLSPEAILKNYTRGPRKGTPRILRFIEMYKTGADFELNNDKKVKLRFDKDVYDFLVKASKQPNVYQSKMKDIRFADDKSKTAFYKLSDLKKTVEFEGKPDRPPAGIEQEEKTVQRINLMLSNIIRKYDYKNGVPIIMHGKIVGYAATCGKVPGTPKSDIVLFDKKGKEVVWISYKDLKKKKGGGYESAEKSFQQWGGMASATMQAFPQVQDFIAKLKQRFPNGMQSKDNIAMKIKGPKSSLLKKKAVYGDDYSPTAPCGRNNVNFVVQGRLDLKELPNGYTVVSTNAGYHQNGDSLESSMDPIFYARYTSESRGFVPHCRATIYPYRGANPKEWLD